MTFVLLYHDVLTLPILSVYTNHTTGNLFDSIQLILTVECFNPSPFRALVWLSIVQKRSKKVH
jgi:hypothetical protein